MNSLAAKITILVTTILSCVAFTGCTNASPTSTSLRDASARKTASVVGVWHGDCAQDSANTSQVAELEFVGSGEAYSREAYFTDNGCTTIDTKRSSAAQEKQALGMFKVETRFPHARGTITIESSPSAKVYTYEIFETKTAEKLMMKSNQTGQVEYFTRAKKH